ncbi:hypothetical protein DCS32_00950 [Dokdonia sp. Dokd-P16]|uniref:hypothetical protein n=1 Tax=Dokdonia sp. Dokd-P16 TaxID=2173169 RepID=UPI000D547221|nr:hypothetical protein [Dokdonia sp. Dokd-P16]AWH72782.1 hypothetical protein DCS32_00950 [Dokdonia sp. Dokd-P16]
MSISELKSLEEIETIYHLDIGSVTMFKNYLVTEFKEGVLLDAKNYQYLASLIKDHFEHLDTFGYISNRLNAYAVVPTALMNTEPFNIPKAKVAIVSYNETSKRSSIFESKFYPFKPTIFDSLPEALDWVTSDNSITAC